MEENPQDQRAETVSQAEQAPSEEFKVKAEQYYDQLIRLQAEFSNFRKRSEKEKADAIRYGKESMVERLVFLQDVMEQALKHSQSATDVESFRKGLEMVAQEFAKFLKSEGAEPIKCVGEAFDPHKHEALEQVDAENDADHNRVLEEIQKGYELNGRLLRPAKVKVAKRKDAVKENGQA